MNTARAVVIRSTRRRMMPNWSTARWSASTCRCGSGSGPGPLQFWLRRSSLTRLHPRDSTAAPRSHRDSSCADRSPLRPPFARDIRKSWPASRPRPPSTRRSDPPVVSGDFTQIGTPIQFAMARDFLRTLAVLVFAVPGIYDALVPKSGAGAFSRSVGALQTLYC